MVDEALAAASIADGPHQDLEGRYSRGSLGYFRMAGAEKDLEKSSSEPTLAPATALYSSSTLASVRSRPRRLKNGVSDPYIPASRGNLCQ
jgi:hypothetical protein